MKMRHLSFDSAQKLTTYVNEQNLDPRQIVSIAPTTATDGQRLTLIFWNKIPAEKSDSPIENLVRDKPYIEEFTPKEASHLEGTRRQLVEGNLAYTKTQTAADDEYLDPETIQEYVERKDQLRSHTTNIQRSLSEEPKDISLNLDAAMAARYEAAWEEVMETWELDNPDYRIDISFKDLKVTGNTVYIPKAPIDKYQDGMIFYKLTLLTERIFGAPFTLSYLAD